MSYNMQKNPHNKDIQIPNDRDLEVEGTCSEDEQQNLRAPWNDEPSRKDPFSNTAAAFS